MFSLQVSPSTKVRRSLIERSAVRRYGKNQLIAFAVVVVGDNRIREDQSDRRGLYNSLSKYLESPTTFPSHLTVGRDKGMSFID